MIRINHQCSACSSEFSISYNELETETDPLYCSFCGEYLLLDQEDFDEDEDDEPL
jgi:hypothetical protein